MKQFREVRKGYDKDEVNVTIREMQSEIEDKDAQITALKEELRNFRQQDKEIKQKSENIAIALTAAVEKAKQIEKSSYNVYHLKIQELELLYNRWERVLNEFIEKYPNLDEVNNVKKLMLDFRNAIKTSVKEDFRFINTQTTVTPATDPMRALLTKMNSYIDRQVDSGRKIKTSSRHRRQLPRDMQTKQSEINRLEEKTLHIKPIFTSKISGGDFESPVDKFLTEDATPDSAYANKITSRTLVTPEANESGFDLKEAVNPKEDLEEIMKSFDFFNSDN